MVVETLGFGGYGRHEGEGRPEIREPKGSAQGVLLFSPHYKGVVKVGKEAPAICGRAEPHKQKKQTSRGLS
ncbi:hypothetical protein GCM10022408_37210 [Hymenobacter fastidiosus]|uniref:Uncharacterized protein n=1 Tax=Hymenobacter fastidiosus TaxID=486264 RepID=A0ABP7T288_9BACT